MNEERAILWADALESGKYRKGTGMLTGLRGGQEYDCCLGVACKVAMEHGVVVPVRDSDGCRYYAENSAILPREVVEWYGLESSNPELPNVLFESENASCSMANDNLGLSHAEIGATIRAKWSEIL